MRNFVLYNAAGESYKLMTRQRFLYSPGGLGFDRDDTFARLGSNYAAVERGYAQGKITGNLYFPQPNAYQKYYDFVRFTDKQPLVISYTPDFGTFYRRVQVSKIDKSELNEFGALDVSVDLTALGLWYRTLTAINNGEQANGKIYSVDEQTQETIGYSYPYVYGESAGVLRIQSDSYEDSPAKLTIFGPVANPSWSHHANSEEIATGAVNATVLSGHKLVIDATTTPYSIKIFDMQNNLISDVYGLSNFATERFIILKQGSNVITVTGGGQVMIEGQISYAGV